MIYNVSDSHIQFGMLANFCPSRRAWSLSLGNFLSLDAAWFESDERLDERLYGRRLEEERNENQVREQFGESPSSLSWLCVCSSSVRLNCGRVAAVRLACFHGCVLHTRVYPIYFSNKQKRDTNKQTKKYMLTHIHTFFWLINLPFSAFDKESSRSAVPYIATC